MTSPDVREASLEEILGPGKACFYYFFLIIVIIDSTRIIDYNPLMCAGLQQILINVF